MSVLKYDSLQRYYSYACDMCKGSQSVIGTDGAICECICQMRGRQKWYLEKVNIRPNSLKYKDWADFNGTIEANGEIIGNLTLESALTGTKNFLCAAIHSMPSSDNPPAGTSI